jgi:TRAF3-interacting protein 1
MERMHVERTQETLGTLISLDERYLANPPFRFLRDAVISTMRKTGFAEGLYSEAELRSLNPVDRRRFLEKLVARIGDTLGSSFDVPIDEVLAGKAPGAANEILAKLHAAAIKPAAMNDAFARARLPDDALLRTRARHPACRPSSAAGAGM